MISISKTQRQGRGRAHKEIEAFIIYHKKEFIDHGRFQSHKKILLDLSNSPVKNATEKSKKRRRVSSMKVHKLKIFYAFMQRH